MRIKQIVKETNETNDKEERKNRTGDDSDSSKHNLKIRLISQKTLEDIF